MTIVWWGALLIAVGALLLGAGIGFFVTKRYISGQLKKNPPINAGMIRAMYSQMGRKPSERQIRAVITEMRRHQK